jgi:hypothetical protein
MNDEVYLRLKADIDAICDDTLKNLETLLAQGVREVEAMRARGLQQLHEARVGIKKEASVSH